MVVLEASDVPSPNPREAHPTVPLPAVGGRLLKHANNWEILLPDPWVRRIVQTGYKIEFSRIPSFLGRFRSTPVPRVRDQRLALEKEISDLLQKGAVYIVRKNSQVKLHRSSFFLTPKKPDTWRPILNPKPLNKL